MEGRGRRITEALEGKMSGSPNSRSISTGLQRVAELAREAPELAFKTLAHHINLDFLRESYRLTRKSGAPGIDGQTAGEYARNLEENLQSLLDRFKSGMYKAPPVRRVHIPKGDGKKTRPIGIPTFEDKILQRAVTRVLEAIYEQDFLDCSYGFRPGRSAHDALWTLREGLMKMGGGWVLEVDIKSFFDTMDHGQLRAFLEQRVRDGVIRRAIGKWLKAGVFEDGSVHRAGAGTPQGGVISPLLANIYLHEVLDKWFENEVKPRLRGRAFLIRYADDFVMVFSLEKDARRVNEVLPKRLGRFGLTVHPEKTRLVEFHPPKSRNGGDRPNRGGGRKTFDLLGFTHYWGKSRRGYWVIKQKTAKDRYSRALKGISRWCRENRHLPVSEQRRKLARKLRGHYQYYGITGNSMMLSSFARQVDRVWRKWLDRRSHKAGMRWEKFKRLLERYPLPPPVAVHSILRRAASP